MEIDSANPTVLLIGINRSGTTAIAQSFLNNTSVEVYKDPGKYHYELTGETDFSHFFNPPMNSSIKGRFIKQSIGQYTVDLCTIPLFPAGPNKIPLIKSLEIIFLIREPFAVWNSWHKMTQWLKSCNDSSVEKKWNQIENEYGISKGWGDPHLLSLCYQYVFSTYQYLKDIVPERLTVLNYEHWVHKPDLYMQYLCKKVGIPYTDSMVNWEIGFGDNCDRLIDGFASYGDLNSVERKFIHNTIFKTNGIEKITTQSNIKKQKSNNFLKEAEAIYQLILDDFKDLDNR